MKLRRRLRWVLDHSLLMGWRFRPLPLGELGVCLLTTLGLGGVIGALIGGAALLVTGQGAGGLPIALHAILLTEVFATLYFLTGGLAGVYLVPLTLRLPDRLGGAVRAALFFVAGSLAMLLGLRFYTPLTGLALLPGLRPMLAVANGVIVSLLGVVIVRFHQIEAEMRAAHQAAIAQQAREAALRELAGQAEIAALQAQINPHFLFNALHSISALIASDPAAADLAVETLGRLFRYTLGASRRPHVRFDEEWEFVRDYLAIEKMRLGGRLVVEEDLDPAMIDAAIPGLLLQPLVENAVVHGIAPLASGGRITLCARRLPDGICRVEIRNVPARPGESAAAVAPGNGVAVANIRRRLVLLYPASHRLTMTSAPAGAPESTSAFGSEAQGARDSAQPAPGAGTTVCLEWRPA